MILLIVLRRSRRCPRGTLRRRSSPFEPRLQLRRQPGESPRIRGPSVRNPERGLMGQRFVSENIEGHRSHRFVDSIRDPRIPGANSLEIVVGIGRAHTSTNGLYTLSTVEEVASHSAVCTWSLQATSRDTYLNIYLSVGVVVAGYFEETTVRRGVRLAERTSGTESRHVRRGHEFRQRRRSNGGTETTTHGYGAPSRSPCLNA